MTRKVIPDEQVDFVLESKFRLTQKILKNVTEITM